MVAASGSESKHFLCKVRASCLIGCCIGLAALGCVHKLDAELGRESPRRIDIGHDYDPGDGRVHDTASAGAHSMNLRSMIPCCLLLIVMFNNIKTMVQQSFTSKGKNGFSPEAGSTPLVFKSAVKSMRSPFVLYGMLVVFLFVLNHILLSILKARGFKTYPPEFILYFSAAGEGLGIMFLRSRIVRSAHAQGISAKSVALFAMLYVDTACTFPRMQVRQLDLWMCKVLEWVTLMLVLDVLYKILVTYRHTYQKELDIVPVKTLVFVCALLAFMFRPYRLSRMNLQTGLGFTFRIYVDTFALVPQVVMMSLQKAPVHAPIAHFVVVSALSRMCDLSHWLDEYKFWAGPLKMPYSGWLVIGLHVASLLVVVDFFYYYLRTWIADRGSIQDVPLEI